MKKLNCFVLITILCVSTISSADTESKEQAEREAEKLLEIVDMDQVLEQSISQMLDVQLQHNPDLVPFKGVMLEFFAKYMSYESLKPELLKMYSEVFTAAELKEINGFYATETGKKAIEVMPALIAQGGQIGAARVQENIEELQAMVKAESERIKNTQSQ
jgi:hypothetical protein